MMFSSNTRGLWTGMKSVLLDCVVLAELTGLWTGLLAVLRVLTLLVLMKSHTF